MFEGLPDLLTVKEVQDALRLSRARAYELVSTEDFPVMKIGRSLRIPKDLLVNWLENSMDFLKEDYDYEDTYNLKRCR